jgi:hypothetical protein
MASIKLEKSLLKRIAKCAEVAGYSSPEEFVVHVLEREMAKLEDADSDEEIAKKLQGLGYID